MGNERNKKVIAAGLLVMSLTMACNSALAPILAEVGKFFPDAGDSAIQIVLTLINLTTLPAMILEPMLEPKITKRDIAVIGTALMLLGGLMPQVLNSQLWMLYAASIVIGVGLSFVVVTSSSLISDYFTGLDKSRVMGFQSIFVSIGGTIIAKGSGMIHPNMGTMLCFVTTDCAITHEMLDQALHEIVPRTFNRVTVDGDTSTNDMCVVLANGMAENELIEWKDDGYTVFYKTLHHVFEQLARSIAADGEGAGKLITCTVRNARSEESAERLGKAVVGSALVKAAMFGSDANWGLVLCAMGYSKAPFRPEFVDIRFRSAVGEIEVCRQGAGLNFDEAQARSILEQDEVVIDVDLNEGEHEASCWGCDLTYDYVKINGDYRT